MIRNLQIFLLVCSSFTLGNREDTITIQVLVKNLSVPQIYLASYWGDKVTVIDSASAGSDSCYTFKIPRNTLKTPGLFRLIFGRSRLDIIINCTDTVVRVHTYYTNPLDSLRIRKSRENESYYNYLRHKEEYNHRMSLLHQLCKYYNPDEAFYTEIIRQVKSVQNEYRKCVTRIKKLNKGSFLNRIIKSEQTDWAPVQMDNREKIEYMKSHYFNHVDFSDTLLLRSPLLTQIVFSYVRIYANGSISRMEQQEIYKNVVDSILAKTQGNDRMHAFFIDYLSHGFEKLDFDAVTSYITEKYLLENTCVEEGRKEKMQYRLKHARLLSPGNKVPSITALDKNGKTIRLYDMDAEKVLIVFWASWCPHCRKILPELHTMYQKHGPKKFAVLAISLDTVRTEWERVVKSNNFSWIDCLEDTGWNSELANDYFLYATPTMILLDKEKRVLALPRTSAEVKEYLF